MLLTSFLGCLMLRFCQHGMAAVIRQQHRCLDIVSAILAEDVTTKLPCLLADLHALVKGQEAVMLITLQIAGC